MIFALNLILAVLGIVLWRTFMRMELAQLYWVAALVMAGIVLMHVIYRLITGQWMDGVIQTEASRPRGQRTARPSRRRLPRALSASEARPEQSCSEEY